jgi:hypothetical protein
LTACTLRFSRAKNAPFFLVSKLSGQRLKNINLLMMDSLARGFQQVNAKSK